MIKTKYILTLLLLIYSSQLLAQEFKYVTDSLKLRMYSEATDDSEVLLTIESGDSVEILEKQKAFSKVVTNDGSVGWVKSAFLVADPPEKLLYYSVSEQNKQLQEEIEALQNASVTEVSGINSTQFEEQITQLQADLSAQVQINQNLQLQIKEGSDQSGAVMPVSSTIVKVPNKIQNPWIIPTIAFGLLIIGFLIGLKFAANRMRKRLHGFVLK